MLHAPHGAICARLLPFVMEANLQALEKRQPGHPSIERYREIARLLTGEDSATAQDGIGWTRQIVNDLKVPNLAQLGMNQEQLPEAVEKTLKSSSFKGNPIPLQAAELTEILEKAL
jgi:alcohol dehydrogenase class IV